MKYKAKLKDRSTGSTRTMSFETYDPDPKKFLEDKIQRRGVFMDVLEVRKDETVVVVVKHSWVKAFPASTLSRGRMFDRVVCSNCGAKGRHYHDEEDVQMDTRSKRSPQTRNCRKVS